MCGVIGVFGSKNSANEAFQGLLVMQHRGQDAAGILSFDFKSKSYFMHKKLGLVDQVFNKESLDKLIGSMSIGHTRYSTIGKSKEEDIQPTFINYPYGMGLVHNGNIINSQKLKENLNNKSNRYILTKNDSEIMANLIADEISKYNNKYLLKEFNKESLYNAVLSHFKQTNGGYAVIGTLADYGMFAFRDPNGIRPLMMGKKKLINSDYKEGFCFASESNALSFLDYEIERSLEPGELIFIDSSGERHCIQIVKEEKKTCMFEWVYFANPESLINDLNVYESRIKMGEILGKKISKFLTDNDLKIDCIVPVPDTSRVSAIRASETTGIRYRELLMKNRYVQRSFILNDQEQRERAIKLKLSPIKHEIKGKSILLLDDSIVRGTTSKRLIELVRKAGAKKVYFASACPPILWPCYYGIDFPTKEELIANDKTNDEIAAHLGADEVIYLNVEELKQSIGDPGLCLACVNGDYPTEIDDAHTFNINRVKEERHETNVIQ